MPARAGSHRAEGRRLVTPPVFPKAFSALNPIHPNPHHHPPTRRARLHVQIGGDEVFEGEGLGDGGFQQAGFGQLVDAGQGGVHGGGVALKAQLGLAGEVEYAVAVDLQVFLEGCAGREGGGLRRGRLIRPTSDATAAKRLQAKREKSGLRRWVNADSASIASGERSR